MPGTRCNIATCNNSLVATRKLNQQISYHTFPKDEKVRDAWIQKCKRDGKWNYKSCFVCSIHFKETDYERDLQTELLGICKRKLLKKDAVPSRNLPNIKENTDLSRELRFEKRQRKAYVKDILTCSSSQIAVTIDPLENTSIIIDNSENQENITIEILQAKLKMFEATNAKLELENQTLRSQMENKTLLLEQYKQELNYEQRSQEKKIKSNTETKMKMLLSQCFTDSQIDILINKKKSVHWNDEDISRAFTLRYYSKRAYIYLRQKLHYPLPSNKHVYFKNLTLYILFYCF